VKEKAGIPTLNSPSLVMMGQKPKGSNHGFESGAGSRTLFGGVFPQATVIGLPASIFTASIYQLNQLNQLIS
jgi:hypothetical protein